MIWKHLGFSRDLFIEPLRPTQEDMDLFVGRDQEVKQYLLDAINGTRALKVVSGDTGVGKTTFVNACQYFSYTSQKIANFPFDVPVILPCFEKIQVGEADNITNLLAAAVTSICRSVVFHCDLIGIEPPTEVKNTLSYFLDLSLKTGGRGLSGGVDILGTGFQFGRSTETTVPNPVFNARVHLQDLVGVVKKNLGMAGVFVNVNNLDILSEEKLVEFVNEARDQMFDIEGIFWTLIGRRGITSIIQSEAPRVAHYISGSETVIEPLRWNQTKEIIYARVRAFGSNGAKCPLSDNIMQAIHHMSMRETRETFKISGEIVKRVLLINPSLKVIPDDTAIQAFVHYASERVRELELTESATRMLSAILTKEKQSCRPKDFGEFGYGTSQGFIAALKGLASKRLLAVEEKGKARIYRITGATMLAALTGALGQDLQKTAMNQLVQTNARSDDQPIQGQLDLELDENGQE